VRATIDHLVVTAPSLESGAEFIRHELGVEMHAGGEHERMGTHNRLIKLGESAYLEVLAVNPLAPAPAYPRWFELDDCDGPELAGWVARVDDIHAAAAIMGIDPRRIVPMSRGALSWLITIPDGGEIPNGGVTPLLIQWLHGPHPASVLPESHCTLVGLNGSGPESMRIRGIELDERWSFATSDPGTASLTASIETPSGACTLARYSIHISYFPAAHKEEDMPAINRTATGTWHGDLKQGNGQIDSASGVLKQIPFSFKTRFENEPGTNPEELIAAAHAACYSMAFSNHLSQQGHVPDTITTKATISMEDAKISKMHLETRGKVDGIDNDTFKRLADEAEKKCPVSNLLRPGLTITLDASLM
jgi:OsmC subfamily peroxiredoxin